MIEAGVEWIGRTVSWGTLLPQDLYDNFTSALEEIDPEAYMEWLEDRGDPEEQGLSPEEALCYDVQELIEMLEERAPDGCWFGVSEGDGTLFGFFTNEDDEWQ